MSKSFQFSSRLLSSNSNGVNNREKKIVRSYYRVSHLKQCFAVRSVLIEVQLNNPKAHPKSHYKMAQSFFDDVLFIPVIAKYRLLD